jgi:4-amino-4-deoxy-L-arabinose transferase-like glycosyltransferase
VGDGGVDRNFRRNLAVVVACGALLRIVRLATKWNHPLLLNDSLYYAAQAQQLAHGVWFREVFVDQPGAEHGPLTSTLMALVSWGSDPFNRQRVVTVACGIATVAVIGLVGRRVAGNRVALLAAALAAVYPNLWLSDGLVMSESVSCLLIALALWAILVWVARPTLRAAVLVGVAIGLGTLARSEVILFVPAAAAVMWVVGRRSGVPRHWAQVMAAVGVAVALLLPWTIFNVVRFEKPVLLTTNEGGALYGANCDDSYFGPAQGGWSLLCLVDDPANGFDADTSLRNARQRREALSFVSHHLSTIPRVELQRVARSLDLFALRDMVRGDVGEERERWAAWAGIVSFWMLAPLAVVGALLTRRRDRAVLLIPVVIVLVTTVVIYGGHRIRSAAEPAIVILAAVAIDRWIDRRLDRQGQLSESVPNWPAPTATGTASSSP